MKPTGNRGSNRRMRKEKVSVHPQFFNDNHGKESDREDLEAMEKEQAGDFNYLVEAFSSASAYEVASAYEAAGCDANKAAMILSAALSVSCSGAELCRGEKGGELRKEGAGRGKRRNGGRRQKILTATSGSVSSVLGKGYLGIGNGKVGCSELRECEMDPFGHEDVVEFLCSMLGEECRLDFVAVEDVLRQCGYNIEKALDTLLEFSSSSNDKMRDDTPEICGKNCSFDTSIIKGYSNAPAAGIAQDFQAAEYSMHKSEKGLDEMSESMKYDHRIGVTKSYLPQKVLESLFKISESSEYKASSMNWKAVVKKMQSFGQELDFCPATFPLQMQDDPQARAKEDDYQLLRRAAKENWNSTKSYYQRAAVAYSRGERDHATYLSEQGKVYHRKAREAEEKASQEIFEARNKDIKNAVKIDLHGQHVKEAIRLLKLHLILFTYIPSVKFLTLITGSGGKAGVGKGSIKQSVISLAKKEGIEWSEPNHGTIVIRLDGLKQFNFFESESDSD